MRIERAAWVAAAMVASGGISCLASTPQEDAAPAAKSNGEQRNGKSDVASPEVQALALKTLSEHLSRPVDEITVVSVTAIDWNDSSIGCPQPDRGYLQVITPGYVAVLQHGGQDYRVHLAEGRAFVCERHPGEANAEKQLVPKLAMSREHLQTLARMDLARRLQVPIDEIKSTDTRQVVWIDGSIGCPEPEQTYKPAPTKGYVLDLSYHERKYTYHSDTYRVIPCPALESN